MRNLAYQNRSWSFVGEGRLRPSFLTQIGQLEDAPIYADTTLESTPAILYLQTERGFFRIYRQTRD